MARDAELHAAVLADPDDDGPRLVYADWLTERGDPRGELIAIQIARSQLVDGDRRAVELAARESELWMAYGEALRPPLPGAPGFMFRRGFLDQLQCEPATLRAIVEHPEWLDGACIRQLGVSEPPDGEVAIEPDAPLAVAAALPLMPLRELEIVSRAPAAMWLPLFASPHLARLERLSVRARSLRSITGPMPRLHTLDLATCELTLDTVLAICEWRDPPRLRRLVLSGNSLGDGGVTRLATAPALRELCELRLHQTGIGDADVAAIAAAGWPLEHLEIGGNPLVGSADVLAHTPAFARLRYLGITGTSLGIAGVDVLAESPHLAPALELHLDAEWATPRIAQRVRLSTPRDTSFEY